MATMSIAQSEKTPEEREKIHDRLNEDNAKALAQQLIEMLRSRGKSEEEIQKILES